MYESHTYVLTTAGKRHFGTRKNSLRVVVVDKPVELMNGYWDSGSRDAYHGMTMGGSVLPLSYPTAPHQFGGGSAPSVMPTDKMAIVKGGFFRGKDAGLTVYVNKLDGWMLPIHGTEKVRI